MKQTITGDSVVQSGNQVIINGKKIDIPKNVGRFSSNTTVINGKVFINGWELKKDGTWKRTLRALWHQLF